MILDSINSPADIKKLNINELRTLCEELRNYIVECCAVNPGHLASSLGAVELIVAVHYIYNTPSDKFVFDVGHQAYAHKILTGRRESFKRLRCEDGISGFPTRSESPYDAFGVGHSSTSISAALGLARSAALLGREEKVVALIGDGAMTGGMAFEGLNNAADTDILILLNDNNQSIDHNTGSLHESLLRMTTSTFYNRIKRFIWNLLGKSPFRDAIQRWLISLKSWIVKRTGGDFFESLGFRYFGPIDGNDIESVVNVLRRLQSIKGPKVLHCMTVKGKGYATAEADPVTWHAPGKFDPATGVRNVSSHTKDRYQDVFGEVLCEIAAADPKVVGVTPAMAQGCGMNMLAERLPKQFFDVGIAEEHAVTFSAGLAAGGLIPFCNIYSSFAQRAYDQIIHDAALQDLAVILCFDRAGMVGEDGATHHGVFDLAALRCVPNLIISSPKDELELKSLMYSAYKDARLPYIIRYPRGMGEGVQWKDTRPLSINIGEAECLAEGNEVAIVALGPVVNRALDAAKSFEGKVGVYNFRFLKPLDEKCLAEIASKYKHIITVEDGCIKGGLYGAVCEFIMSQGFSCAVKGLGIPDEFIKQDRQSNQEAKYELDCEGIKNILKNILIV